MSRLAVVMELLRAKSFRYDTEKDLQAGIEEVLQTAGIPFARECSMGAAGVIDFLIDGGLGLEVKIDGAPVQVLRQLLRYAERPEISELLLVTGKVRLAPRERTLLGKPFHVVPLWRGCL